MLMNKANWVNCNSRSDLEARLSRLAGRVFEASIVDESNTWGYIISENDIFIPVGFSDVGLAPKLHIHKNVALVGVSDILSGYNLDKGKLAFTYKMPTVFHEFALFTDDDFIVQDEIGFVGLSYSGNEKWLKICDDIIATYNINDDSINGETLEGMKFNFAIG